MSNLWCYINRHMFAIIVYALYLYMWVVILPIQFASGNKQVIETPYPHCDFTAGIYMPIMLFALIYTMAMLLNLTFRRNDNEFYGVMIILTFAPFLLLCL